MFGFDLFGGYPWIGRGRTHDRCVSFVYRIEYWTTWIEVVLVECVGGGGAPMYGISIQRLYMNINTYIYVAYLSFSPAERNFTVYIYIMYTREILLCEHFIFELQYFIQRGPAFLYQVKFSFHGRAFEEFMGKELKPMLSYQWRDRLDLQAPWTLPSPTVFPSCFLLLFFCFGPSKKIEGYFVFYQGLL